MPLRYNELLALISNESNDLTVLTDTFVRFDVGSRSSVGDYVYIKTKYNKHYLDFSKEPEYVSMLQMEVERPIEGKDSKVVTYSYLNGNEFNLKGKITMYYSMTVVEKDDPDFIKVFKFFDNAFLAAFRELKTRLAALGAGEDNLDQNIEDVFKCVNSPDFEKKYPGYVQKEYVDKKTKKKVTVEEAKVRLSFSFKEWHASLKGIGGKQTSRVSIRKSEEEIAAKNPEKKYRRKAIDEKINPPTSVFEYTAGTFFGHVVVPGTIHIKGGKLTLKPEVGEIYATEDPERSVKKSTFDDLADSDEEEETNSSALSHAKNKLSKASKVIADDNSDEENVKPKKKSKAPVAATKPAKKQPMPQKQVVNSEDEAEESGDNESEDETPAPSQKSSKAPAKTSKPLAKPAPKVVNSEDEAEDSENNNSEDETPAPTPKKSSKAPAKPSAKPLVKPAAKKTSQKADSENDSDFSD